MRSCFGKLARVRRSSADHTRRRLAPALHLREHVGERAREHALGFLTAAQGQDLVGDASQQLERLGTLRGLDFRLLQLCLGVRTWIRYQNGRKIGRRAQAVERLGVTAFGGHRRGWARHRADCELLIANLKLVARLQRLAAVDALAVDENTVGAAKIFDGGALVSNDDLRVAARNQAVVEDEVAIRTSTDEYFTSTQLERPPLVFEPEAMRDARRVLSLFHARHRTSRVSIGIQSR